MDASDYIPSERPFSLDSTRPPFVRRPSVLSLSRFLAQVRQPRAAVTPSGALRPRYRTLSERTVEMQEPPDSPHPHTMMTSDEVDWLVYSYLQESGESSLCLPARAQLGQEKAGLEGCLCLCSRSDSSVARWSPSRGRSGCL